MTIKSLQNKTGVSQNITPEHLQIRKELGDKVITKIAKIVKGQKLSFLPLINLITEERIIHALENTNHTVDKIANDVGVHRSTVYRIMGRRANKQE